MQEDNIEKIRYIFVELLWLKDKPRICITYLDLASILKVQKNYNSPN
jgi:hypothetical protein